MHEEAAQMPLPAVKSGYINTAVTDLTPVKDQAHVSRVHIQVMAEKAAMS